MIDPIREALKAAQQFIRNGVELGYIRMPDADTPDPAHQTLPKIEAALKALTSSAPGEQQPVAWLQSQNGVEIVSKHRLDPAALEYGWTEQPLYTSAPPAPGWDELEPVLSFLDELAANAASGKRESLNPILIGGSAKLYAEGLREALRREAPSCPDDGDGVRKALDFYANEVFRYCEADEAWVLTLAGERDHGFKALSTLSNHPAPVDANASAEARLREALDCTRRALVVLRVRLSTEPTVQGRSWIDLGIMLNNAVDKADNALSAAGGEAKKSEGGVKFVEGYFTDQYAAGERPPVGPSDPTADRREIVAQALCHLRNVAKNKETWTPECERVYQGAQKAAAALDPGR